MAVYAWPPVVCHDGDIEAAGERARGGLAAASPGVGPVLDATHRPYLSPTMAGSAESRCAVRRIGQ